MEQTGLLALTGFELATKRTRKHAFLDELDLVIPRSELLALIGPHAPAGKTGPSPFLSAVCCASICSNSSLSIPTCPCERFRTASRCTRDLRTCMPASCVCQSQSASGSTCGCAGRACRWRYVIYLAVNVKSIHLKSMLTSIHMRSAP